MRPLARLIGKFDRLIRPYGLPASVACVVMIFVGCTKPVPQIASFDWNKYPVVGELTKATTGPYLPFSSSDGTFLVNQTNGKVYRFDQKKNAFLETPVTSEIIEYERGPDGQLRRKPRDSEKNQSGKPCDKKTDPLCIM